MWPCDLCATVRGEMRSTLVFECWPLQKIGLKEKQQIKQQKNLFIKKTTKNLET